MSGSFYLHKGEGRYWNLLKSTGGKHRKKAKWEFCNWFIKKYQIETSNGRFSEGQNSVRRPKILIGTCCATLRKKASALSFE